MRKHRTTFTWPALFWCAGVLFFLSILSPAVMAAGSSRFFFFDDFRDGSFSPGWQAIENLRVAEDPVAGRIPVMVRDGSGSVGHAQLNTDPDGEYRTDAENREITLFMHVRFNEKNRAWNNVLHAVFDSGPGLSVGPQALSIRLTNGAVTVSRGDHEQTREQEGFFPETGYVSVVIVWSVGPDYAHGPYRVLLDGETVMEGEAASDENPLRPVQSGRLDLTQRGQRDIYLAEIIVSTERFISPDSRMDVVQ